MSVYGLGFNMYGVRLVAATCLFGPAHEFQFTSMIIERLKRPTATYVLNNLINLQNFNKKNPTLRLTLSSQPHTPKTHLKANIEAPNAGPVGGKRS